MSATLAIDHLTEAIATLSAFQRRPEHDHTPALIDAAILQAMRGLAVLIEMRRDR